MEGNVMLLLPILVPVVVGALVLSVKGLRRDRRILMGIVTGTLAAGCILTFWALYREDSWRYGGCPNPLPLVCPWMGLAGFLPPLPVWSGCWPEYILSPIWSMKRTSSVFSDFI